MRTHQHDNMTEKSATRPADTPEALTSAAFHEAIHSSIGKPVSKIIKIGRGKRALYKRASKEHACPWASTTVNLKHRQVRIEVYLDFQKNKLDDKQYANLMSLAKSGISHY